MLSRSDKNRRKDYQKHQKRQNCDKNLETQKKLLENRKNLIKAAKTCAKQQNTVETVVFCALGTVEKRFSNWVRYFLPSIGWQM